MLDAVPAGRMTPDAILTQPAHQHEHPGLQSRTRTAATSQHDVRDALEAEWGRMPENRHEPRIAVLCVLFQDTWGGGHV